MGRKLNSSSKLLLSYIKKKKKADFEDILEFIISDERFSELIKSLCNDSGFFFINHDPECISIVRDWVNRRLNMLEKQGHLVTTSNPDRSRIFCLWSSYLEISLRESLKKLSKDINYILHNNSYIGDLVSFSSEFSYLLFKPIEELLETIYEWGLSRGIDTFSLWRIMRTVSNKYGVNVLKRVYGPIISALFDEAIQETWGLQGTFEVLRVDPSSPFIRVIERLEESISDFLDYLRGKILGNKFNWELEDSDRIKGYLDSFTKPYSISKLVKVKFGNCDKYKFPRNIVICLSSMEMKYLDRRVDKPLVIKPNRVNKSYLYKLVNRVREFVRFIFKNNGRYVEEIVSDKFPVLKVEEFIRMFLKIVSKRDIVSYKSEYRREPIVIGIVHSQGKIKDKLEELERDGLFKLLVVNASDLANMKSVSYSGNKAVYVPIVVLVESPESISISKQNQLIGEMIRLLNTKKMPIGIVILEVKDPLRVSYTYKKKDMVFIVI